MAAHAVGSGAFYVLQRIGDARVLGQGAVRKVLKASLSVHADVFQNGPEPDGGVYLGFFFFGKVYCLGVTAALEVKDSRVRPAMLVVPDQGPFRVGGERSFTGSGEAEEERYALVLADVGRTVHRHHVVLGR